MLKGFESYLGRAAEMGQRVVIRKAIIENHLTINESKAGTLLGYCHEELNLYNVKFLKSGKVSGYLTNNYTHDFTGETHFNHDAQIRDSSGEILKTAKFAKILADGTIMYR